MGSRAGESVTMGSKFLVIGVSRQPVKLTAMSKPLGIAALLFALSGFAFAQNVPPSADWQKVRDHQPAALNLKMTLAKDHFYQGEKIDATLDFVNDDASHPYILIIGNGMSGGFFYAQDATGHQVANPRQQYYLWHGDGGFVGFVSPHVLGAYSLTLPVNDSVRFDQPGDYTLFAESMVTQGTLGYGPEASPAWIVSDKTTITILPLTPDKEKQIIADALNKIGTGDSPNDSSVRDGISELNALQTPAARESELPLLSKAPLASEAGWGFIGAANPSAEAPRIMEAVQSGKLLPCGEAIRLYGVLKASGLVFDHSPTEQDATKRAREMEQAENQARKDLITAMLFASGQEGPNHVEALWIAFQQMVSPNYSDLDGGVIRAELAKHQLELAEQHVHELINLWIYHEGSADFLPLIRREANKPKPDPSVLIIFAGLSPREARPLVLKEFDRQYCPFFARDSPSPDLYCFVKPMPLPEIDSLLRKKFAQTCSGSWPILPAISCFGSSNLLPDVLAAYHRYGKGWDSGVEKNLFCYWLRADPKQATVAYEHEITTDEDHGLILAEQLNASWTDNGLPIALWMLKQPNAQLVLTGIGTLQQHADLSTVEPILSALKRIEGNKDWAQGVTETARGMLASTRWHYTDEQRKRLEALASTPEPK